MVLTGDRGVCRSDRSGEVSRQREPSADDVGAERDELVIPHVERRQRVAADAAGARRLEQRGPLLQHAVVISEHAGHARRTLNEELVGEASSCRRVGTDDLQVFRREQHDLRVARELGRLHR